LQKSAIGEDPGHLSLAPKDDLAATAFFFYTKVENGICCQDLFFQDFKNKIQRNNRGLKKVKIYF